MAAKTRSGLVIGAGRRTSGRSLCGFFEGGEALFENGAEAGRPWPEVFVVDLLDPVTRVPHSLRPGVVGGPFPRGVVLVTLVFQDETHPAPAGIGLGYE